MKYFVVRTEIFLTIPEDQLVGQGDQAKDAVATALEVCNEFDDICPCVDVTIEKATLVRSFEE